MKFKLDENFGVRTRGLFLAGGFDVETVAEEGLSGGADETIFAACSREGRCLITLDLDFCDIVRFPPQSGAGVVVIRASQNPTLALLERLVTDFLLFIAQRPEVGRLLWIVEPGRIRVRADRE